MDWATFKACLEDRIPVNLVVNDEKTIGKCVDLTTAIQEATEESASNRRPRGDPRPLLPASVQDQTRPKDRLKSQWKIMRDSALKAQVNRLQKLVTYRLKECRNEQWSDTGIAGQ
jgi:hypothetical protein